MPDFQKRVTRNGKGASKSPAVVNTQIADPRCQVCNHKQRKVIDKFLARGTSYADLERTFAINHQAIRRHDLHHLNLKDSAIRTIIRREAADAEADLEEGIEKIVKRRVYLEAALEKALDAILDENVMVEPRDAVAIIEKLEDFDRQTTEAQITEMKIHFQAIMQAVKEIVPSDQWERIAGRAQELAERQTNKVLRA